ncbi:MAG: hypothetical protein V1701_07275 [Planctomycetota bacterium]
MKICKLSLVLLLSGLAWVGIGCSQGKPPKPEANQAGLTFAMRDKIAELVKQLGDENPQKREFAQTELVKSRNNVYPELLAAWEENKNPEVKLRLANILQLDEINQADIIVAGNDSGLGYYSKIPCDCLGGSFRRFVIIVDSVLKGQELFDESQNIYDLILKTWGDEHAAHEIPELKKTLNDKKFLLLSMKSGVTEEELKTTKVWLLKLRHKKFGLNEIHAAGTISSDLILEWIFDWQRIGNEDESRIRETIKRVKPE